MHSLEPWRKRAQTLKYPPKIPRHRIKVISSIPQLAGSRSEPHRAHTGRQVHQRSAERCPRTGSSFNTACP